MNKVESLEIQEKLKRVRSFLEERDLDALILGRKDNFAWFTCGGYNEVVIPSEVGFALLLITADSVRLIAHVMDGQRVIDEELNSLEVEYVPLHWYELPREQKAAELIRGLKAIADIPVEGAEWAPKEIQRLHFPLTDQEIDKLRHLGRISEKIIRSVADEVKAGMREIEVAGMFLGEYGRQGIQCDVLLVGSDERISHYRHPYPSDKAVDRYILLHPAVRKWGLHANITRLLHFGPAPEEIQRKFDAACRLEAASIALCRPGTRFADIQQTQKEIYAATGFTDEWRYHFQGAITGYILADPILSLDPEARVVACQAYDWFITITGVKVEELSMNTGNEREICSVAGNWPTDSYEFNGETFELPQILIR